MCSVPLSRSERESCDAEETITLSKCPACGFWTGASDAPRTCPECREPMATERMDRFYPY